MKILITGFDAFNNAAINPTEMMVKRFKNNNENLEVHKVILGTCYHDASVQLRKAIDEFNPETIICFGQSGGRGSIEIERVAINICDAKTADNNGLVLNDHTIKDSGPMAYASSLPLYDIVDALRADGIPARVSNSAGTFVCNYIMYELLYMIEHYYPEKRGGFLHVPYIHEQVLGKRNTPSIALGTLVKGLEIILETCMTS